MPKRKTIRLEAKQRKLLLWVALAGLIFGIFGFGDISEGPFRTVRNILHWHKASGEIVLIKIDDQSLRSVGRWPWPRRYDAKMTDILSDAGAKRIFFDISLFGPSNPVDDREMVQALKRSGRTYLATRTRSGPQDGAEHDGMPLPMLARAAKGVGNISWRYNFQQTVTDIPYSVTIGGRTVPSFAALLSGREGQPDRTFTPDYSVNPRSIPTISAAKLLNGQFDPRLIEGKDVIIGADSEEIGDQFFVPGTGRIGGVYVHIIGAETLKQGRPVNLGWVPLLMLALASAALALSRPNTRHQGIILTATVVTLLIGPAFPESHLIYFDIMPALFVTITIASVLGWRGSRR